MILQSVDYNGSKVIRGLAGGYEIECGDGKASTWTTADVNMTVPSQAGGNGSKDAQGCRLDSLCALVGRNGRLAGV